MCLLADTVYCKTWPQQFVLFPTYEACMNRGAMKILNDQVRGIRFIGYNIICTRATIPSPKPEIEADEHDA